MHLLFQKRNLTHTYKSIRSPLSIRQNIIIKPQVNNTDPISTRYLILSHSSRGTILSRGYGPGLIFNCCVRLGCVCVHGGGVCVCVRAFEIFPRSVARGIDVFN